MVKYLSIALFGMQLLNLLQKVQFVDFQPFFAQHTDVTDTDKLASSVPKEAQD